MQSCETNDCTKEDTESTEADSLHSDLCGLRVSAVNGSGIKWIVLRSVRHPFQVTPLPTPGWRGTPAWSARHPSQDRAPPDLGFLTSYLGVPATPARIEHHPTPGFLTSYPGAPAIPARIEHHPTPENANSDLGITNSDPGNAKSDLGIMNSDLGNTKTAPRIIPLRANAMRGGAAGKERGPPSPQQALPAMSQRISHDETQSQ